MSDFERDDLEQRLHEGLRRVEAPAGFAERVMARAGAGSRRSGLDAWRRSGRAVWLRPVAAALVLAAALGGRRFEQRREEAMQAREAQRQFYVAMGVAARVTERSFTEAGRRINRTEAAGEAR